MISQFSDLSVQKKKKKKKRDTIEQGSPGKE